MSLDLIKGKKQALSAESITDADYADDLALFSNTSAEAEFKLHSLEQAAGVIGFHLNANKTEYTSLKREVAISTLNDGPLKLVGKFTYLGRSISSTKCEVSMHIAKAWIAIDYEKVWSTR